MATKDRAAMKAKAASLLVPLLVGVAGAAIGTFFFRWANGQSTNQVGAIVAALGTAVTAVGWYQSTGLQAKAQRELLHLQLLNEGRKVLVQALHVEQDRLGECAARLHGFITVGLVIPPVRQTLADFLRAAPTREVATAWIFPLEEHAALFPEVRTARLQLLIRGQKLHDEFRRLADVLVAAAQLPKQFDTVATEVVEHVTDQSALFQDLSIHVQNRAFAAVSGHHAEERMAPDPRVPRLVMDGDQLVVHVPDPTRRVQLQVAGWLPPKNPPGS